MVYDYTHDDYVAVTAPNFVNGSIFFYDVTDYADFPAETHVIYDEKFNPDGTFDKDKAREVVVV